MMRVCQRLQRHLWELGILKRLIVSPAIYPRIFVTAELARSLPLLSYLFIIDMLTYD